MSDYNVSVRVSLIDQVSRRLALMSGSFGGTERMALQLQRRLREMEGSRFLSVRRAELAQRVDRDALSAMNMRYAKILATGDLEHTQQERTILNRKIIAREQASSIRRQEESLRLQKLSNDMAEKRAALNRTRIAARGERVMSGLATVGGVAAIGAGVAFGGIELARAGLPITKLKAQLQIAGGLNRHEVDALASRARSISGHLAVVDWEQEMQIALQLYKTVQPKLAAAMLKPVSYAADLTKLMDRGPLDASAGQFAQISNILGATTQRQTLQVSTAIANVLRSGGAGVTMGELANWSTYVGSVIPGRTPGQRAKQMEEWGVLSGRYGKLQGAFSGENIRNLLRELTHPKSGLEVAAIQTLQRYGLSPRPEKRTFGNIVGAIRRGEAAQPTAVLRTLDLLVGRSSAVAMLHQISRMKPSQIKAIEQAPAHNVSILSMWKMQMRSASAQVEQMQAHLRTTAEVIGVRLDPALAAASDSITKLADHLQKLAAQHPKTLKEFGQNITLLTKLMTNLAGIIAPLVGLVVRPAVGVTHTVLKFDNSMAKYVAQEMHRGHQAISSLEGGAKAAVERPFKAALGYAERTGIIQITGPVHVHGVVDTKSFVAQLHRAARANVKAHGPAVSPHVYPGQKS